jgi:hypothetical protein
MTLMKSKISKLIVRLLSVAGISLVAGWMPAVASPPPPEPTLPAPLPGIGVEGSIDPFDDTDLRLNWAEPRSPLAPQASGGPDQYGYTWADGSGLYDWVDAGTLGEEVLFPSSPDLDEGYSLAIDIGFTFKYYENSYTQLFASTNGLITFGAGTGTSSNVQIPRDTAPNNYLAVFWDDLAVGGKYNSGQMYSYQGADANGKFLVVEWSQVTRINSANTLTFQAILYQSGDIEFQYQVLDGDVGKAVVGIEDGDGTDGLLYLYYSDQLAPGQAVLFERPAPDYRVKVLPGAHSGFTINGEAFLPLEIRNTGEKGADTYNLNANLSSYPDWKLVYFDSDQTTHLKDNDHDLQNLVDTGPLAQGASKKIYLRVRHDPGMEVGQYLNFDLHVSSSHKADAFIELSFKAASPAAFAQASVDSEIGPGLHTVWAEKQDIYDIAVSFGGSSFAISPLSVYNFLYLWEENAPSNMQTPFTDLEYAIVNRFGKVIRKGAKLTDNETQSQDQSWQIMDRSPSMATIEQQKLAIVWVRDIYDLSNLPFSIKMKSNIYLSILDRWGEILVDEVNLTQNNTWNDVNALDVPTYRSPVVAPLQDDQFAVSWVDSRTILENSTRVGISDLAYAVYNSDGQTIKNAITLTASQPNKTAYVDPMLVGMSDGYILLSYSLFSVDTMTYQIGYAVLDSGGNFAHPKALIPGASGWGPDGISLSSGDALLAWTNTASNGVAYTMIDGQGYSVIGAPHSLDNPGFRRGGYVSVAKDGEDHSVLTWMDANWNQYLYYALVRNDGSTVTPPMVFHSGEGENPFITTSKNGQGNTSYDPSLRVHLPLIASMH